MIGGGLGEWERWLAVMEVTVQAVGRVRVGCPQQVEVTLRTLPGQCRVDEDIPADPSAGGSLRPGKGRQQRPRRPVRDQHDG